MSLTAQLYFYHFFFRFLAQKLFFELAAQHSTWRECGNGTVPVPSGLFIKGAGTPRQPLQVQPHHDQRISCRSDLPGEIDVLPAGEVQLRDDAPLLQ